MPRRLTIAVPLALVAIALVASSGAPAGPVARGEAPAHPEVDPADDCAECHEALHPDVVSGWYGSQHGLLGVKCLVCHGSAGADFVRQPAAERCLGCHAEQVDSIVRPFFAGRGCFACHPPHALSPHRARVEGGAQ